MKVDLEFMRKHLAEWGNRYGTPADATLIRRWLQHTQAWDSAFINGWPHALQCAKYWEECNDRRSKVAR